MKNKLQQLFPMIKTRENLLKEIHGKPYLTELLNSWPTERQEEFISFVTGASGVKMLYDSFFKEVLNPETVPERLTWLLTLLLGKDVQIIDVLPLGNSRLADEESLVVMDIVVKLDDGSIIDVEIQKIGYYFPGQRSACYSSDLLLRQYKAVRDKKKQAHKRFSYKDIHKVYTIIFLETSPKDFHTYPDIYLHNFQQKSDTGLILEHLQEYFYIPLDIFNKNLQNKSINNDLDAWLTFLSTDTPERIAELCDYNPVFKDMYGHIYEICQNVEGVMQMFSKELRELDRNTAQFMIDDMQSQIEQKDNIITKQSSVITGLTNEITEQANEIAEQANEIAEQANEIAERDNTIASLQAEIARLKAATSPDET